MLRVLCESGGEHRDRSFVRTCKVKVRRSPLLCVSVFLFLAIVCVVVSNSFAVTTAKTACPLCIVRFCIHSPRHLLQLAFVGAFLWSLEVDFFAGHGCHGPVHPAYQNVMLCQPRHLPRGIVRARMHSPVRVSLATEIYASPERVVITARIVLHILFIHLTFAVCVVISQGEVDNADQLAQQLYHLAACDS